MLGVLSIAVLIFAVSYGGIRLVIGPPRERPLCNLGMQSFDLREQPIYWQVQEGACMHDDPNYSAARANIEEALKDGSAGGLAFPEVECFYGHYNNIGFVVKYGTDYYDVEDMDCIEPLREMQREKEENTNLMEYFKENFNFMKTAGKVDAGNILAKML